MIGHPQSARFAFIAAVVLGVAACAPAEPPPPADMSAEAAAAIRQADTAFETAASSGDVEAAMAMHMPDAMAFPPGQPMVSGSDAVRQLWTEMTAMPGFAISWQVDGTAAAAGGDLGYSWGTAQLTMNGPDGTPMTSEEKYVTVWRKDAAGAWKIAVDIFNSNAPPPGGGN
jgi:ketosteroid isomerase-like protein